MSSAAALRSLALLGASGASIALFLQELTGNWVTDFIKSNALSLPNRQRLMIAMAVGAFVMVVVGLVAGRRGGTRLQRVSHLLAPAVVLGFIPPLCLPAAWSSPLNICLAILAVIFLGERLLRLAFAAAAVAGPGPLPLFPVRDPSLVAVAGVALVVKAGRIRRAGARLRRLGTRLAAAVPVPLRRWSPLGLVIACAAGYAVYMSIFTLFMHWRFQTYGYDLGQYDNIFWSTLHGHPLRDAPLGLNQDWHELRNHAELSVFFFLPFYAIKPGGAILLVIQSTVLGLGAIPLYRFAARRLPRGYAAVIAIAYLFYPPMHGLQFYDFHFQPVASTFVLLVIDFVDERRYVLCALAFLIAIGCREDISIGLTILGVWLALTGYRFVPGLIMAVSAGVYFVVIRFIVMPSFGPGFFNYIYKDLMPEGAASFGGVIATMISNPLHVFVSVLTAEKLRYALQILLPVALLPLRRTYLVPAVIHGSILTLLTTQYAPTIDIGFQYSAHFIPYIFTAAAVAIAAFGAEASGLARRRAALSSLVMGTALCGVFWGAIPPRESIHGGFFMLPMRPPTDAEKQRHKDLLELHALVPPDASLAVGEQEMPHISRLEMRGLRDTTDADYILYSLGSGFYGSNNGERVLASGEFEKIAERPYLVLLKRKPPAPPPAPSAPIPPATPTP